MFDHSVTKEQLIEEIVRMDDIDFDRLMYCQHIAATHLAVGQFEEILISAMLMCNRVRIEKALGSDMERWQQLLTKRNLLKGSTIGSLIKILERHGIDAVDIAYLKWVKDKRDYFVHRLFHDGAWPGDLNRDGCRVMTRRLLAIQKWLQRAGDRIWRVFENAGFLHLQRVGGGYLASNPDLGDLLGDA